MASSSHRSTCRTAILSRVRNSTTNWTGSIGCIEHAAELLDQEVPVVLAGDYNVVPTDFDIYSVKSFVKNALLQPAPRAAYAQALSRWVDRRAQEVASGRTDVHILELSEQPMAPRRRTRLDHLLLSPAIAPRLKAAGVDRDVRGEPNASDHAPAWIELAAAAKPTRKSRRR